MSPLVSGMRASAEKLTAGDWLGPSVTGSGTPHSTHNFWASNLINYLPENSDLLSFHPLLKDQHPSLCFEMHRDILKPTLLSN